MKPPIVKGDGYRVFLDMPQDEITLYFSSGIYEDKTLTLSPEEWTAEEVLTVELSPGASYPM